jgi:hypothetical protein
MSASNPFRGCSAVNIRTVLLSWLLTVAVTGLAEGQSVADSEYNDDSSGIAVTGASAQVDWTYKRATQAAMLHNYHLEAFGPYPIAGAAFTSGINHLTDSPPEWRQGVDGYGKRFGSNLGIATVRTTTRYALAQVLKEDTLYYRCECKGVLPRLGHAAISTLTGRRGEDGHRVFSFPALVAPYAGTMAGIYGWYPSRFGAKDAFRMGNYSLLAYMGGNISLEFLHSGTHSFLSRIHMNNAHGAPDPGSDH